MALTFNGSTSNYAYRAQTFSASKGTLMGMVKHSNLMVEYSSARNIPYRWEKST